MCCCRRTYCGRAGEWTDATPGCAESATMDPIVRIVRRVPNVFTVLLNRPAARNAVDRDTAIALVVRSNAWGLVCAVTVALK